MSYKKIPEIPRSEKTYWSPERGGRIRQRIGGKWVDKFAYSPFTAKAREIYTFYADVEMAQEIESPPESGRKKKFITVPICRGCTYLEFRDKVLSGEAMDDIIFVTETSGGGSVVDVTYWRNRMESREDYIEFSEE